MAAKDTKQWFLDTHWGKLAMISWGQTSNAPVLLVHGYMDTAASFIPLVNKLPDTYYYVAVDLPGNGLSHPLPAGMLPSVIHLVEVIRIVVSGLNWEKFIFIGHSMAVSIGKFYYAVYPNQISKVICLEPLVPISLYYLTNRLEDWYSAHYSDYYENYLRYNSDSPKHYTHAQAIKTVARSRNLTEEQAEVILSRALVPVDGGKYRLSWDSKMKKMTNLTMPKELLYQVLKMNAPPTLWVCSTEPSSENPMLNWGHEIMAKVQETASNYFTVFIKGDHDIHITNSEEVASHIIEFLKRPFHVSIKSNL